VTLTVEQWLSERRAREPSIKQSVNLWVEFQPRAHTTSVRKAKGRVLVFFHEETLREIHEDAGRHGRSLSQSVQQAWLLARGQITKYPSANREET